MEKMKLNIQRFTASCSVSVTSCTQSIDNNSSTIKIKGTLTTSSTTYNYGGAYMKPTINNQPVVGTQTASQTLTKKKFSIDKGDSVSGTWTFTVYHNNDGTCNNLSIATAWYVIDQYQGTKTISYKPATIPRASDVSASTGTLNTPLTITITRKNNTFVHTLRYECGNSSDWIKDTDHKVADSASWTPPLELASENKSGQSVQCKIYCQTYDSGGNPIGTETYTTITLTIPTLNPQNVSIASIADGNSYKNTYGVFIQNKSKITATLAGTAQYSDIKSYLWEIRQTNSIGTLLANGNTSTITYSPNVSGTLYIYGKVTDKREAYTTTSTTVSVTAYSPPTCQLAVSRVSSTSASYTMSGTGTAISTTGYTANTLEFKLVRGSTTVRTTSSGSSYTGTDSINDQSYTYTLTAKDTISGTTDTKTVTISTTFTLMNFNSTGYGMAIGKASEATGTNKLLEIALPTTISENVTMTSGKTITGNLTGSVNGNANTATTLATFSYSRNNATNTWCKVATTQLAGTWGEKHAILFIKGTHNTNYNQNGIIAIDTVGGGTAGAVSSYAARFFSCTPDLDASNFYIEYKNGNADTPATINFWLKMASAYAGWHVKLLQNVGWTIAQSTPTTTTMPSSGFTGKNSEKYSYAARSWGDKNGSDITTTYQKAPVQLYNNTSGTNASIQLSETSANFEYIEFFYKTNDGNYASTKVYGPNGKTASLTATHDNGTYVYIKTALVSISGTNVTFSRNTQTRIGNNVSTTHSADANISIVRIIGYK